MQEDEIRSRVFQSRMLTTEQITQLLNDLASKKSSSTLVRKFRWAFVETNQAPFWNIKANLKITLSVQQLVSVQNDLRQLLDPLQNPRQLCHVGHMDGELDLAIPPERVSLKRDTRLSAWFGAGVDCRISKDEIQTMARIAIYFTTWQSS